MIGHKLMVPSDEFRKISKSHAEMGWSTDHLMPVDMNFAFVPQNKDAQDNLETMAQNSRERFGLETC